MYSLLCYTFDDMWKSTNNKKESFIGQKKMILTIMSAVNYSYWWIVYDRICFQTIAENILLDYIYQKLEFYKEW